MIYGIATCETNQLSSRVVRGGVQLPRVEIQCGGWSGVCSRYREVAGDSRVSSYLSRSYDVQLGSWDGDADAQLVVFKFS